MDYDSITIEERKMNLAVAQDVLEMIDVLSVQKGKYIWYQGPNSKDSTYSTPYCGDPKALQEHIPEIAKYCTVCAKGAMLLAHIHLYDNVSHLPTHDSVPGYADAIFGKMGDLIEIAFEHWDSEKIRWEYPSAATTFGLLCMDAYLFTMPWENTKERLRYIMQNIVVNGGIFYPVDRYNKGLYHRDYLESRIRILKTDIKKWTGFVGYELPQDELDRALDKRSAMEQELTTCMKQLAEWNEQRISK